MSHFSVCVAIPADKMVGREIRGYAIEEILDEILAPFDESPTDYRYMEFEDMTSDAMSKYMTEKIPAVLFPDGSVHTTRDKEFSSRFVVKSGQIFEKIKGSIVNVTETANSRAMELVADYPLKEIYSFGEYCESYCSYEEHDGRWGYWTNPDSHLDWYVVGGRFPGEFLVKSDLTGCLEAGDDAFSEQEYKLADGVRKADVQWAESFARAKKAHQANYRLLVSAFAAGDKSNLGPFSVIKEDGIHGWNEMLYRKGESMEEYLIRNGLGPDDRYRMECYAFVDTDGQWHSMGDMGWFGLSSNDKDQRKWHDEVQNFIEGLSDDDFLVTVDCHI